MNHTMINILTIAVLFSVGMTWTVFRYAKKERLAFAIVAVLSPALALYAMVHLIIRLLAGKARIEPCPAGLADAERQVEEERVKLFGGVARERTMARNWQRAYEFQLQRDAEYLKKATQRVLMHA